MEPQGLSCEVTPLDASNESLPAGRWSRKTPRIWGRKSPTHARSRSWDGRGFGRAKMCVFSVSWDGWCPVLPPSLTAPHPRAKRRPLRGREGHERRSLRAENFDLTLLAAPSRAEIAERRRPATSARPPRARRIPNPKTRRDSHVAVGARRARRVAPTGSSAAGEGWQQTLQTREDAWQSFRTVA